MSAGVSTQLKIVKRQSGPDSMDGKQINNLMGNRNNVADLQESSSQIQGVWGFSPVETSYRSG